MRWNAYTTFIASPLFLFPPLSGFREFRMLWRPACKFVLMYLLVGFFLVVTCAAAAAVELQER